MLALSHQPVWVLVFPARLLVPAQARGQEVPVGQLAQPQSAAAVVQTRHSARAREVAQASVQVSAPKRFELAAWLQAELPFSVRLPVSARAPGHDLPPGLVANLFPACVTLRSDRPARRHEGSSAAMLPQALEGRHAIVV